MLYEVITNPIYEFIADQGFVKQGEAHKELESTQIDKVNQVPELLDKFINQFAIDNCACSLKVNGLFGYSTFDAVQYFDTIKFKSKKPEEYAIPELRYTFFKYIIVFNHFTNQIHLVENLQDGETSDSEALIDTLYNRTIPLFKFEPDEKEVSNLTDEEFMQMVTKGKEHCYRGDVFQIVLSRQFKRGFKGDEFNVYRALRNINPSPYLFYFDSYNFV